MGRYTAEALKEAAGSIASMIDRSEDARKKFVEGSSQHTLLKNRIYALTVAQALVQRERTGACGAIEYTKEGLEQARAPLASLIMKSEKAQAKLAPGAWQHTMLENNLKALRIAFPLLEKEAIS